MRKDLFGEPRASEGGAVEHLRVTREQDVPHENFPDISDGNSHRTFRADDSERVVSIPFDNKLTQLVPPSSGSSHRGKKGRLHRQIRSMSSSEDDLPSTSFGEVVQRVPDECASEKAGAAVIRQPVDESCSSSRVFSAPVIPGDMLAAKIRTYLSHPVTWQPSADQRRLIGHMVLHKTDSSVSGDLGLKVVGGRRSDNGRLGAFITRVKPGSVADTIGRLKAGQNLTFCFFILLHCIDF
uniref:PDZ domain-containing protein n=1 Tax=Angiostrongylus cantonensis TaxID=6313 RepID=A0A0K0DNP9_ANGCA